MTLKRCSSGLCLLVAVVLSHVLGTAADSPLNRVPIEAKLLHSVQAGRLKVGDPVFAKVQVKWQGVDCVLREGAILRGSILAQNARSKTEKTSAVSVLFDAAECNGAEMKTLPLILAALIVRDPSLDSSYETLPLSAGVRAIGNGPLDRKGPGQSSISPMQSITARTNEPPKRTAPSSVKPGDVVGIDGVKLGVSTGPQGSSVVSSSRHNLNLEAGTQMVLVVNSKPSTVSAPPNSAPLAPSKVSETEPAIDETEICSPPACNIALAGAEAESLAHSWTTVPTKSLGYPPLPTREMFHFDHEAAITFLGADQLLFTFNPHTLVARPGLETAARTLRIIRGALIDVATMKVKRVIEWRVPDENQYLWPLANNRVLIHAGRELKVYGPGLKFEQTLTLEGPLAFLRSSPSGAYLAIGVTSERHSDQVHQQLLAAEGQEPEEDVNIRVVDATLKSVVNVTRSSRAQPPVLLDTGELQTTNAGGTRWRITEHTWAGQQRDLVRVNSTCRPQISSLPPSSLFVVGCEVNEYGRWFRVLNEAGKPVLKGRSSSDELEQAASGSATGRTFAVGVAKVARARMASDVFHAADLKSQFVSVYNSQDGKRLLAVTLPSPVPTLQTFALSPDGTQLVVIQADQIALYRVSKESASSH